jgi:hypothetical protein
VNTHDIEKKLEKLPDHVIPEINDYIDFLLTRYGVKNIDKTKFNFDWEGKLSKFKDKYTSIELQHKALDWR